MGVVNGLVLIEPPAGFSFSGTSASFVSYGQISYNAITELNIDSIFSAEYDDYMIVMSYTSSTASDLYMRFRANGATLTTSFYTHQSASSTYSETTVTAARTVNGAFATIGLNGNTNSAGNALTITVMDPFAPQKTNFRVDQAGGRTTNQVRFTVGTHNQAVYIDGINIYPSGGTITGNLNVYGVRK